MILANNHNNSHNNHDFSIYHIGYKAASCAVAKRLRFSTLHRTVSPTKIDLLSEQYQTCSVTGPIKS